MSESLSEKILKSLEHVEDLYHRLILVVAPSGRGKTRALQEVAQRIGAPLINVNLELSRRMLDLTERQRMLRLSELMTEIANCTEGNTVLLDNTEMLFDVTLRQDPLRVLQGLSRNKTVIASWNGTVQKGNLVYAVVDHEEYRRYPVADLMVVTPDRTE